MNKIISNVNIELHNVHCMPQAHDTPVTFSTNRVPL